MVGCHVPLTHFFFARAICLTNILFLFLKMTTTPNKNYQGRAVGCGLSLCEYGMLLWNEYGTATFVANWQLEPPPTTTTPPR